MTAVTPRAKELAEQIKELEKAIFEKITTGKKIKSVGSIEVESFSIEDMQNLQANLEAKFMELVNGGEFDTYYIPVNGGE